MDLNPCLQAPSKPPSGGEVKLRGSDYYDDLFLRRGQLILAGLGVMFGMAILAGLSGQSPPASIMRFVEGIDALPKPMTDDEIKLQLNDPWGLNILRKGNFPADLDNTLKAITATGLFAETDQDSFFVSESGQIPSSANTMSLQRQFRIVVTRKGTKEALPSILISAPAGDRHGFIELISWDPVKKALNYYRRPPDSQWAWKGDTGDAFKPATQNKGCFRCHINGVPVMKELKLPWQNWHSQSASISSEAIPDDDIRNSPLFIKKSQAEHLEKPIIRGWIEQATQARISSIMKGDAIPDAPRLLRSLFVTTTVNLSTSGTESKANTPDLNLPAGLFLNFDIFADLNVSAPPGFSTRIKRPLYQSTLTTFAFHLDQDTFSLKGDTHFAFLIPEPAQEDVVTIRQLLAQKIVTRHFVASVLLIDFQNPIFSSARENLLRYVPMVGPIQDGRSDLSERTAQAILQASASAGPESPERQFAEWWNMTPDQLQTEATKRVQAYLNAVQNRLKTQAGLEDYTRLAESRRQRFGTFPLNEFELLLPRTNIPAADRRMLVDGTVSP
jgi:hypothetical protein